LITILLNGIYQEFCKFEGLSHGSFFIEA